MLYNILGRLCMSSALKEHATAHERRRTYKRAAADVHITLPQGARHLGSSHIVTAYNFCAVACYRGLPHFLSDACITDTVIWNYASSIIQACNDTQSPGFCTRNNRWEAIQEKDRICMEHVSHVVCHIVMPVHCICEQAFNFIPAGWGRRNVYT